jgi:hypothetical protein
MIVLLPTLLHVVVVPDKELVSTLSHWRLELMVDCSSIEKVDEVRCAKGECVVGESHPLCHSAIADTQTHASRVTPLIRPLASVLPEVNSGPTSVSRRRSRIVG